MANQYLYDLSDTWNNVATTFDAIKINVTDTNSATASKLIDLQVGGVSKFKVQKDGDVTADRLTVTKTTANAPAISSTGYSLTGSDASSLVDLAGTWNTTGNPTAIKLNVTSTASGTSSLLMDMQVGGASKFAVTKEGRLVLDNASLIFFAPDNSTLAVSTTGFGFTPRVTLKTGGVFVTNEGRFGFCSSTNANGTVDAGFFRDAADTIAQRRDGNAQAFRVYRTWTDASNYEALELAHATVTISSVSKQYSILRTITAGSGADDINLVLSASGTGAIMAQLPDGTATGGNARGIYAVDFQLIRESNTQCATGNYSVVIGGRRNAATATYSGVFGGDSCSATGQSAVTLGGAGSTASAIYSVAFGLNALANKRSHIAQSGGTFTAVGDAQSSSLVLRKATTDATASEMFLDGTSERLTIPANTAWHADIRIIGRQVGGANHAIYHRKCCIERTVNATALVSTVQTIGTDIETDANWDVAITADDTNDALKIEVTGVAATNIRWVAEVRLVEVAYA